MGKRQIDLTVRAHDAQAVRAQHAHAMTAGIFQRGPFECGAARSDLGKAAGNNDHVAATGASTDINDGRYRRRFGTDDGEIQALRDAFDGRVGLLAEDRFVLRIDKEQLALVAGVEHVAHQRGTDRVGCFGGSDDCYRSRLEQWGEIVFFVMHLGAPQRMIRVNCGYGAVQQRIPSSAVPLSMMPLNNVQYFRVWYAGNDRNAGLH